jgi:hypothetical protein
VLQILVWLVARAAVGFQPYPIVMVPQSRGQKIRGVHGCDQDSRTVVRHCSKGKDRHFFPHYTAIYAVGAIVCCQSCVWVIIMTIILFLVDTSASMNQRTHLGTTVIDVAKGAVEQFIKVIRRGTRRHFVI